MEAGCKWTGLILPASHRQSPVNRSTEGKKGGVSLDGIYIKAVITTLQQTDASRRQVKKHFRLQQLLSTGLCRETYWSVALLLAPGGKMTAKMSPFQTSTSPVCASVPVQEGTT